MKILETHGENVCKNVYLPYSHTLYQFDWLSDVTLHQTQPKVYTAIHWALDRTRRGKFSEVVLQMAWKAFLKVLYCITEWAFSNHFTAKKKDLKSHLLFISPWLVVKRRGALGFPSAISKQINAAGGVPCQYRAICPLPWLSGESQKWKYMTHDTSWW